MKNFFKKIANFWYYYKWHTIIGVFSAIVIGVCVWQVVSSEDYDYTVMLYTSRSTTTALSQALEKTLCEYGEDLDNNGKVSVQVLNVSYSDTDTNKNFKNSQAQALRGELLSERCFLVITDDTRFEQIKSEGYFEKLKELSDKDGYAYTANDKTPLGKKIISEFKNMGYEYYGDVENGLNLSLRYSGDDKNTDAATRREQQKQLLLKIAEDK